MQSDGLPVFSFLMPTYNSHATLEMALASIRAQDYPQERVEILVADGGSTDDTRQIAARYGCRIIDNPDRLPEPGIFRALCEARSSYITKIGSDEVMRDRSILRRRADFFKAFPDVKCIFRNEYLTPAGCGVAAKYANTFGDPFSCFIYRNRIDGFHTYEKQITQRTAAGAVMAFSSSDIAPLADSGTTISLEQICSLRPRAEWTLDFCSRLFEEVVRSTGCCGCIPEDRIVHYGKYTFRSFLAKNRFRVINNVFHEKESGFSVKAETVPLLGRRKKRFYLYALTLVGPLFDSVWLSIRYRESSFLLHFVYLYYVCFYAAYCYLLKFLGKEKTNSVYGK